MINIKFYLKDKRAKQKTSVRVSVAFNGNRLVFSPGYSISPNHWNFERCEPKSVRGNSELGSLTNNLKELDLNIRKLYQDISQGGKVRVTQEMFKDQIYRNVISIDKPERGEKQISLLEFMDTFIHDSERGIRLKEDQYRIEENSIKPYRTTRLHFDNFQKRIGKKFSLLSFDQNLHDEFSSYLIEDLELAKNAHSKYIMVLSQVIKYAVKKKLFPAAKLHEIKFNTRREASDNIFLTEDELQLFMNLKDFKCEQDEHVRDIFILGCYTGLRFSNYSKLNLDYIKDDIITTVQVKTKKRVSIPIHKHVKSIIEKYNGVLPPCPTNQEFNRTLKELGQRIPELHVPFAKQITRNRQLNVVESMKWENLCTHTARRSFCTNMYLLGVPVLTIMAISGHKTEKSFLTYIKASGLQHAQLMKKHWEKSGG